jgi:hypothetical protein
MNGKLIGVLAVTILGLAAVAVWLGREAQRSRAELAAAKRVVEQEREARQELEGRAQFNDRAQRELKEKVYDLSAMVAGLRASENKYSSNYARLAESTPAANPTDTNAAGGLFGKGMGDMLSKMMKDPAMREMMRSQQKMVLKPVYEPLMREWNMSLEDQQKFMDLLLDQQMSAIEKSQGFFGKEKADLAEFAKQTKDAVDQSEQGLKDFLGEEKFAQHKEYQKTLGERMQLNQFKTQLAATDTPLRDDQYNAVMAFVKEERDKSPPQFGSGPEDAKDISKVFDGDAMDKHLEWQGQINQRVRERAANVLSPEQLRAFADFQEQQLSMQKFGIKMAREMFGGKAPEAK